MDNIRSLKYLPQQLQDVKEFNYIYSTAEIENDAFEQEAIRQLLNLFIETADEEGIEDLETKLSIKPKATDSLSDRKFRLLARINQQLPYSWAKLHQQMQALCGEEGYSLNRIVGEYKIIVRVALTAKSNFDDVGTMLERVVPYNTVIDLSLLYNQNSTLAQFTHAQLNAYTHKQLREEVLP